MKANADYLTFYNREISYQSNGEVADVDARLGLIQKELGELNAEKSGWKGEWYTVADYRQWMMNVRDNTGAPASKLYGTILGFEEIDAVRDMTNLSDAYLSDIMRNSMRLYGVMQGELMDPYMDVARKFVVDLD